MKSLTLAIIAIILAISSIVLDTDSEPRTDRVLTALDYTTEEFAHLTTLDELGDIEVISNNECVINIAGLKVCKFDLKDGSLINCLDAKIIFNFVRADLLSHEYYENIIIHDSVSILSVNVCQRHPIMYQRLTDTPSGLYLEVNYAITWRGDTSLYPFLPYALVLKLNDDLSIESIHKRQHIGGTVDGGKEGGAVLDDGSIVVRAGMNNYPTELPQFVRFELDETSTYDSVGYYNALTNEDVVPDYHLAGYPVVGLRMADGIYGTNTSVLVRHSELNTIDLDTIVRRPKGQSITFLDKYNSNRFVALLGRHENVDDRHDEHTLITANLDFSEMQSIGSYGERTFYVNDLDVFGDNAYVFIWDRANSRPYIHTIPLDRPVQTKFKF